MQSEVLQPVAQAATKAGESLITQGGILGTLLILSLIANGLLVWLVVRTQNLRVADRAEISDVAKQMVATFTKVEGMLANVNDSSKAQTSTLQMLTNTMNSIVMAALGRSTVFPGTPTPPPGSIR